MRSSIVANLEVLHLVTNHAGPQAASEAEKALSRHSSTTSCFACDKGERKPEEDWNHVGNNAIASLEHRRRCIIATDIAEQALQKKNASEVMRSPEEIIRQLRKIRPKSLKAKAAGVAKAKYLQSWKDSLAKARADLGLPVNAAFVKASPLYKKAKEFHNAAKESVCV